MKKFHWMTAAALGLTTAAAPCLAQSGLYLGASLGSAQHSIDTGSINRQLVDLGFSGAATSSNKDDTAFKVTVGWQTVPHIALEVSYVDLGEPEYSSTATRPGTFGAKLKTTAWTVDLVPQYQFGNGIGILGRIGFARTESKADFSASGAFRLGESSGKEHRNGWDIGLGVSYAFTRNLTIRAEWTHFPDIGGDAVGGKYDTNLFTAGALWKF